MTRSVTFKLMNYYRATQPRIPPIANRTSAAGEWRRHGDEMKVPLYTPAVRKGRRAMTADDFKKLANDILHADNETGDVPPVGASNRRGNRTTRTGGRNVRDEGMDRAGTGEG